MFIQFCSKTLRPNTIQSIEILRNSVSDNLSSLILGLNLRGDLLLDLTKDDFW